MMDSNDNITSRWFSSDRLPRYGYRTDFLNSGLALLMASMSTDVQMVQIVHELGRPQGSGPSTLTSLCPGGPTRLGHHVFRTI